MFDEYKTWLVSETAKPLTRLGLTLIWITPLIIVADQASKAWILYGLNLPVLNHVKILPFFAFSMVGNKGISFGLLGSGGVMRWVLTVFQLGVAGFLTFMVARVDRRLFGIAMALIAGGAIGNAIDRIRLGSVVDFLDFSGLYFPWVFNVADSAICIGIALLLWHFLRKDEAAGVNKT